MLAACNEQCFESRTANEEEEERRNVEERLVGLCTNTHTYSTTHCRHQAHRLTVDQSGDLGNDSAHCALDCWRKRERATTAAGEKRETRVNGRRVLFFTTTTTSLLHDYGQS